MSTIMKGMLSKAGLSSSKWSKVYDKRGLYIAVEGAGADGECGGEKFLTKADSAQQHNALQTVGE
jgi:hypothetical protein